MAGKSGSLDTDSAGHASIIASLFPFAQNTAALEVTKPWPSFGFCEALGKSAQSHVASFPVTLHHQTRADSGEIPAEHASYVEQ
jgi:hypothetical protein